MDSCKYRTRRRRSSFDLKTLYIILAIALELILQTKAADNVGGANRYDVVIYRANPGGISAAIAAANMGGRVLLLEPTAHIGGMATEGGIGLRHAVNDDLRSDPKNSQNVWGRLNAKQHNLPDSVLWQPEHWMGEQSFYVQLRKARVEFLLNTNFVEGSQGVKLDVCETTMDTRISALQLENGTLIEASFFIDASYEGELMQAAGVDYAIGREAARVYNESLAGITFNDPEEDQEQFRTSINPLSDDGKPLRYVHIVEEDPLSQVGEGDDNVMPYSFHVCMTKDPTEQMPVTPPEGYDPQDFELVRRFVKSQLEHSPAIPLSEPWEYLEYMGYNQVADHDKMKYSASGGTSPISIGAVGLGRGYANATRAQRLEIWENHRYYVQGLLWFYRNDSSIPQDVRDHHAQYGFCKESWSDHNHFPRQLDVREAARLVGDRVFTQADRLDTRCKEDSIAVGDWGFEIKSIRRLAYEKDGSWTLKNEGRHATSKSLDVSSKFEIPYWTLLPKRKQASNLAVVSSPSFSHVAFSTVRSEPTFWALGQAAGTAAATASFGGQCALHDVDVRAVQRSLLQQGVVIHWPPTGTATCDTAHPSNDFLYEMYDIDSKAQAEGDGDTMDPPTSLRGGYAAAPRPPNTDADRPGSLEHVEDAESGEEREADAAADMTPATVPKPPTTNNSTAGRFGVDDILFLVLGLTVGGHLGVFIMVRRMKASAARQGDDDSTIASIASNREIEIEFMNNNGGSSVIAAVRRGSEKIRQRSSSEDSCDYHLRVNATPLKPKATSPDAILV